MRLCDLSVSGVRVKVKDFLSWGQGSGSRSRIKSVWIVR
jgi:hypothetical protein